MIKVLLASLTLLPVITGPLPHEEETFLIELCSGGQITIPLGRDEPSDDHPCDPQACHAGTCREKIKKAKLI